jgi:uncharacterized protein YecE (DUF72 family)
MVAWEPRGDWLNREDLVAGLCEELDLIHCVDLLRRDPYCYDDTAYVRLHGLNEDPYDYDYDYSDEELRRLADRLGNLSNDCEQVFCLFNNHKKFKNVVRLDEILG